jgi:methylenetetrahydrofolate reductase (NADPH)
MAALSAGLDEVGISGYPESHHFISDETTIEAMFEKEPMAGYIVSQICFDADVIRSWIRRVRERGTTLPIWIGVPGAVETSKLLRTSLRIGLGQSVRFLRGQRGMLRRFLGPRTYTPTELLMALAPSFAEPAAKVGGIHVYTFNELENTETWRRQLVDRLTNQEEPP